MAGGVRLRDAVAPGRRLPAGRYRLQRDSRVSSAGLSNRSTESPFQPMAATPSRPDSAATGARSEPMPKSPEVAALVPSSFAEYLRSFGPGIVITLTWLGAGDVVDM